MIPTETIEAYCEYIKNDYLNWTRRTPEFVVTYKTGNKYIKITTNSLVHSFIVNTDKDEKFPLGTILMAKSWKGPARNYSRGNVMFDGGYNRIRWTGAA